MKWQIHRLRPCGVWRWLRREVALHGVTGSTCHPSGRQLPTALPRLSRRPAWLQLQLVPAGRAGQWQPCTGWDALRAQRNCLGHSAPRLSVARQDLCFPSTFRLEHASSAWLSQAMSAQRTRTFYHPMGPWSRFPSHGQEALWMSPGLSCL